MTPRGKFITLEGSEGSGKTTAARHLGEWLRSRGEPTIVSREPGGTPLGDEVRRLVLHLRDVSDDLDPRADAFLYAAARAQHTSRVILPALERGDHVVSARYLDSSLAYQGGAGGLGLEAVRALHVLGSEGFLPDRTLVLVLDEGSERARARDCAGNDRIGGRSAEYHHQVDEGFRLIANQEPERVRLVDASGSQEQVTQRLLDAIADMLP